MTFNLGTARQNLHSGHASICPLGTSASAPAARAPAQQDRQHPRMQVMQVAHKTVMRRSEAHMGQRWSLPAMKFFPSHAQVWKHPLMGLPMFAHHQPSGAEADVCFCLTVCSKHVGLAVSHTRVSGGSSLQATHAQKHDCREKV